MSKIAIKGVEYNLRYTLRAMFIFEQITSKPFSVDSITDNYVYIYSMLLACNKDCTLSWDSFIEAFDDDPSLYGKITAIINAYVEQSKTLMSTGDTADNGKKG